MIDFEKMIASANAEVSNTKPCCCVDTIVVDASNLLYRFCHAESKNVTRTAQRFIEKLVMLQKWYGASKVQVCWEGDGNNWRFDYLENYKGNRKEVDQTLRQAAKKTEELLVKLLSVTSFDQFVPSNGEGDDGFCTLAYSAIDKSPDQNVAIYTTDRDLLQLVTDRLCIIMPQRGAPDILGDCEYIQKYLGAEGFLPHHIQDIKGLQGDAGDNIPGVKGIGKVVARAAILEFGSFGAVVLACEQLHFGSTTNPTPDFDERLKRAKLSPAKARLVVESKSQAYNSFEAGGIRAVPVTQIPKALKNSSDYTNSCMIINSWNSEFLNSEDWFLE